MDISARGTKCPRQSEFAEDIDLEDDEPISADLNTSDENLSAKLCTEPRRP